MPVALEPNDLTDAPASAKTLHLSPLSTPQPASAPTNGRPAGSLPVDHVADDESGSHSENEYEEDYEEDWS